MSKSSLFFTEHIIETDVSMTASIRKEGAQYQWSVGIGVNKDSEEMISFRGNAESVRESMVRIRALLLSMDDALQDVLADVKHFVIDEYTDDLGGKNEFE